MGNAVSKYADEFNLKVEIDVAGLTEEQASALKCRLAESKILVADDSAKDQIRLDAATADVDNAIANAIKLERASTDYMVETKAQSGSAKTSVSMSGRGDVNWRKLLNSMFLILAAAAVVAFWTWFIAVVVKGPK